MKPVVGFYARFVGGEAPFWCCLFARGENAFCHYDLIQRDAFDAFGSKIDDRAVVRLIGEACCVFKNAELCFVIPNGPGTGDALVVALVEDDAAGRDYFVFSFVNDDLVCLHAIDAIMDIDVSGVVDDSTSWNVTGPQTGLSSSTWICGRRTG